MSKKGKKSVTPLLAADARAAALHGLSYGMYKALRQEAREKEIERQKRRSKKLKFLKVWEVEESGDGAKKWSPVLVPECVIEQIKINRETTDKYGHASLTVVARHGDDCYDYYIIAPGADREISALRQGDAIELADLIDGARKMVSRDGSLVDPDHEASKAFEVPR